MALYFGNSSGVTAWVTLIWAHSTSSCGPFSPFAKWGWWQVNDGQTRDLWSVDLLTVNAVGAFFAEQWYNGQGLTWGDLGPNNDVLIRPGQYAQCYDDLTGCTQRAKFGVLAFNTASNMLVRLLPHVPEEPTWDVIVFD
jgi:hypothetical protein